MTIILYIIPLSVGTSRVCPRHSNCKKRLEDAGVIVSDAGVYAMKDIHQIYCYDPSMNVVEINQRVDNKHVDIEQDHPIRIEPGNWYIHHVNRQVHDMPATAAFYEDLIGMKRDVFHVPDEKQWVILIGHKIPCGIWT